MNKIPKVIMLAAVVVSVACFGILGCGPGEPEPDMDELGMDAAEIEALEKESGEEPFGSAAAPAPEGEATTSEGP